MNKELDIDHNSVSHMDDEARNTQIGKMDCTDFLMMLGGAGVIGALVLPVLYTV